MEQEQTNEKQTSSATKSTPGQALLALGSRECDQFFLEDENRFEVKKPVPLTNFFTALSRQIYTVACGALHTVILTTNGEVYTFGCNDDGALGRTGDEQKPAKVDLDIPVDMISAGDSHSVACNSSQSVVYHWGVYRNTNKGNISKSETPHRIGEDEFKRKKVKRLLSGANHTLALVDGKIYAWGDAEVGILGRLPTSRRKFDQGLKIEGMGVKGVVDDIYTGAYHAFLKKTEKKKQETYTAVYAWGLNNCGQLGIGNTENTHMPVEVTALRGKNIKNITGGEHHTIVLTEEGEVYSFGKNDDGQLGLGQDFEEKEESEEEETEDTAENKKTPAKAAKPPAKSTSKKGKGKGKKGSQKKKNGEEEDEEAENEEAEKKEGEEGQEKEKEAEKEKGEEKEKEQEKEQEAEKKEEDKGAEAPAPAEPEKTKTTKGKSGKKETEKEPEGEAEGEKKFSFKSVKKPQKVDIVNVEKIFSGSHFNYAVTKEYDVYSWGMGENHVLATRNEDAVYLPAKLDAATFDGKRIVALGLGSQHVIALVADKDDKDPELEEEVFSKVDESTKSGKKGTTAKKGEKKGKGKKDEEEPTNDKDIKKNLSSTLEEETEDKEDKKGQKKSLKRKTTDEKPEDESGVKKVKKSPSKEKEAAASQPEAGEKKAEEPAAAATEDSKMEEEKPKDEKQEEKKNEDSGRIEEEPPKAGEGEKAAEGNKEEAGKEEGEKKEESGKMEEEKGDNKEGEKQEEKPAEQAAQQEEEPKKIEVEQPQGEAEKEEGKGENKEAQAENENKAQEESA